MRTNKLDKAFQDAARAFENGNYPKAVRLIKRVRSAAPNEPAVLHLHGLIALRSGKAKLAIESLEKVMALDPNLDRVNALASAYASQGTHNKAIDLLQRTLNSAPNHTDTHYNLANFLKEAGDVESAVSHYESAIRLEPDFVDAHYNLGNAFTDLGRHEDAAGAFQTALKFNPHDAVVMNNLGNALLRNENTETAIEYLSKSIEANPEDADTHYNLGNALNSLERYDEAINSFQQAIKISPNHGEAHGNMANALNTLMRHEEAMECAQQAIEINPHLAGAHNSMGNSLGCLKRFEEAIECYRRAIEIKPDHADACHSLGNALKALRRYEEAIESYRRVIEFDPVHPMTLSELAFSARMICDWSEYDETSSELTKHVRQANDFINPFNFLSFSDDPEDQLSCARQFVEYMKFSSRNILPSNANVKDDRIRVAYVSADFREHPVAYQIAELFELHDRDRFEIIGVSLDKDNNSPIGARLRRCFDHFIDVQFESDRSAAELIAKQNVHIVVDLNGYTEECRPEIFAHRPAPIQVNYLGYPSTMGADFIDYIIVDSYVVAADQQVHFSEALVHLPDSYMVTDSTAAIAGETPSRSDVELPQEGFVFCCFHNANKITPAIFDVWLRLLAKVPGSVLWLRGIDEVALRNLRRAAAVQDIDADRLVIAERVAIADHYARHRLADLFLDTLPYNAHSSACDALRAGLPVVTCPGHSFASRVAGSLLHAIGMPELVTDSLEAYEALALKLAREPELLAKMRDKLARNRTTTALFDSERFCRNLEAAYVKMFETWREGEAPKPFVVETTASNRQPTPRAPANQR